MIMGGLALAVATAASMLGAHAILRRIQTGDPSVDTVLFLLLRLLLVSVAVLAAGLIHALTALGMGLGAVLALAGLLASGEHRHLGRLALPAVGRGTVIFTGIVLLRLTLQVWFFSPHLGDALAYHLPKIGEWIRAGSFTRELGLHPHATFPAGFELIESWWVVFLHHDVLIEWAGVEFLILAFASTNVLARRIGLSETQSWTAALVFVLTPGLHLSTTSCLNDVPSAAMVIATAALVAGHAPWGLLAMTVGLGLGIKPTYGFALPGIAVLGWGLRREPRGPSKSAALGWTVAGLGLGVGAFWYIRNALWYGNPFYPLGTPGLEDSLGVQFGPRFSSLRQNLLNLVTTRIYDHQGAYGANVDHISGWGPVSFACGLLACTTVVWKDIRLRRLLIAFLVSLLCSMLFIQNDPWCLKYVLFFPVVLAIASVRLVSVVPKMAPVLWTGVASCFLVTMLPYDLPANRFRELAGQHWQERSALSVPVEASGGPIGCFGGPTCLSYGLYRADFSRSVVYLRSNSLAELMEGLARSGARVLYGLPGTQEQYDILVKGVELRLLRPLQGNYFAIR